MLESFARFLNSQGYIPHGHCYLWQPDLVWLHIVSDSAIALAYFSIPITLVYFVSQRKDIPFNWIFWMFGSFIIACGAGHLMEIWTLWHPTYWLAGFLKAVTALISVITALELIPLVPKVLALPSPAELEATNRALEDTLCKLQQAQLQLIQTEKMSSLGQLVAGVAHEINNPVNFIHGNVIYVTQYTQQLLQLLGQYQQAAPELPPAIQAAIDPEELEFLNQDLPKLLASMQVGTERIRQLVLSLRNFSRLDEAQQKSVNIHEGIESTLLILQHRLKPRPDQAAIAIVKEFGELPRVDCFAGQLNQVFMNVLSNAIDALEERLKAENTEPVHAVATCPQIRIETRVVEPNWIVIRVSDNGKGIPVPIQQQIFNPFFTTKPSGRGTGLGLSISRQIVVEQHKGQLECCSTPGHGTTFQIKIPVRQVITRPDLTIAKTSSLVL